MLSIQPLKSAEGAASYYLDVINYYQNDSKSVRWLGAGAKQLGIHGQTVEKAQMLSLLSGKLPDGTQLGSVDKDGIRHRPGFDMTLSAPKSFSILLESGADPRLAEVLDKATEWFVEEMEKEFAQTRQIVNGKVEYINTNNLVIAAFRQPNSRANDPNAHVHLVVQNMTHCPDDKWRSLASDMEGHKGVVEQIMKHHIYGGLKFRNKLAILTKDLGYTFESDKDGLWEIQGVPEDVCTHFSKRRTGIEELLDEKGWSGAKASSLAAQKTKPEKEAIDFDQWKKDIVTQCHDMGFDPHKFVETTHHSQKGLFETVKDKIVERFYGKQSIEMGHAKEAVTVAMESVSQQQAVFSLRSLKQEALKYAIASNQIVDEKLIDNVIHEQIKNQELYQAIHPYTRQPLLTTPWQLALESEAIQRIENGKGTISAICSKQTVTDFIKAKESELKFSLSGSQKKAMNGFLTSTDRFMAIQGYAGTGKTTMLRLTRELAELQGFELRGITAGSAAANELRTKGGLDATTFARELGRLKNEKQDLSKIIFVVDEASMLSNPQGHKIIKLVEENNAQLKIIGDKAQLPTPSSGKLFSVIQDYGIDTVAMTDNLRQTDPELKESAIHASRGEIYDAVEKLTHVEMRATYPERVKYIADKWLSLAPEEREKTLCFAPRHKNRHDITALMRTELIKEGGLTGPIHQQETLQERNLTSIQLRKAAYYMKGDIIRFNHSNRFYNIKSGDYLSVGSLTNANKKSNKLTLVRENGQKMMFRLSALPAFKAENKDLERPVEIYRKQTLDLMAGDKIQWKRNSESKEIRNSELATIKKISPEGLDILTEDNRSIKLGYHEKELRHLDHGYVLTTYASQGKDKKRGLGLIESLNRFAASIENYYVETTRGVAEMIVVTDDKERLVNAITTNDSSKFSSIEFVEGDTLRAHNTRFKDNKNSLSLQNVIEKKLSKDLEWQRMEATVTAYAEAKEIGDGRLSAKLSTNIVSDPKLYRLARERLGYGVQSYRRDALQLETSKRFHSLPPTERALFSTVRQYVDLNQHISKRAQHIKIHELEKTDSSQNKKALQELATRRNALAATISQDLERFKPHLMHYSIGELNRIGLPQHQYGKESKNALKKLEMLAKHASLDQIRTNVVNYLKATGEDKEKIAVQIKRESKLSHAYVLTHAKSVHQKPDDLWKAIYRDARSHSDRLFRNGLSGGARNVFDKVKAYKSLQMELKESWSESLKKPADGKRVDAKSVELINRRNELAHYLATSKALPEIADYFKLDIKALAGQDEKHRYRDNIQKFVSSNSNFKARLAVANDIKSDIKGHYPFLKEANLDTKVLAKYFRVTDRQDRFNSLSTDEIKDYKLFLQYKRAGIDAYNQWKNVHGRSHVKQDEIGKAITQSSKRDYLAYQLKSSPYLDSILSYEKGDREKVLGHSHTHQTKLRELKEFNEVIHTLAKQYPNIESKPSTKELAAWKNNWVCLCKEVNQIEKGKGYQFAIQDHPIKTDTISDINQDLHLKYDFKAKEQLTPTSKSINSSLQRIQKTTAFLDANVINEALMIAPEETYKSIFGEPKSENARELRYSGGLIVTLKGKDKGLWHDFSEGVGGAPIQAIMTSHNLPFKEAIKVAADLAGIHQYDNGIKANTVNKNNKAITSEAEIKARISSAKSIWDGSKDAKGTLAEQYLIKHRGIHNIDRLDVRYWPKGATWKNTNDQGVLETTINKIPALVVAARNEKNEITGVQRIYLDERTGGKNQFMDNPKLSKGIIEGSCGIIQKGMRGSRLYIAEGPETATSIAMADSKATVLVSFGISNMKNLGPVIKKFKTNDVILAADNDGSLAKSQSVITSIIDKLNHDGINIRAIFPDHLEGQTKTDWNDILLNKGISEIQKKLTGNEFSDVPSKMNKPLEIHDKLIQQNKNKETKFYGVNNSKIVGLSKDISGNNDINILVSEFNNSNGFTTKNNIQSSIKSPMRNREIDIDL